MSAAREAGVRSLGYAGPATTVILVCVSFLHNLDRTVMSGLLQLVKQAFSISDTQVGALSGVAFGIAYAALGLPFARLADTRNRKLLLTLALGGWSALTLLCGLTVGFWSFFVVRLGVAVFEAAGAPAMHSLLADQFTTAKRAGAAALITMAATFGAILGVAAGGIVADHYGWRVSFWLAGAPGLLLTPFAARYLADHRKSPLATFSDPPRKVALAGVCMDLLRKPALCLLLLASATSAIWLWGTATWFTTFLVRVHGMSISSAALGYGVLSGGSTVVGVALGGWVGNLLPKRDLSWFGWLPSLCMLGTALFSAPVYLVHSGFSALGFYIVANVFYGMMAPVQYAAIYGLTGSKNRALGVSLLSFITYLVGLGLAPMLVGSISDALAESEGAHSLASGLLIVTLALPLSALLWAASARFFKRDVEGD